ncbi:MAG: SpoVA/SpoVAEb family sporulation membrane protein [Anaerovoracaceae bacterium]|jgi:stage V sporulation protein AC
MGLTENNDKNKKERKKDVKAYRAYVKEFTPRPKYVLNSLKAFMVGGGICCGALYIQNLFSGAGVSKTEAATITTVVLICVAQLLTGLGLFDSIAKFAGAGCMVPITGFANSMVAPAIEYKKEGLVLGVGGKLFSLAGPVLVCGISTGIGVALIKWLFKMV